MANDYQNLTSQLLSSKSLNLQQMLGEDLGTQKVINDQQSEIENQLSLEENSKLVQDLKTISAVIEAKKPAIIAND